MTFYKVQTLTESGRWRTDSLHYLKSSAIAEAAKLEAKGVTVKIVTK